MRQTGSWSRGVVAIGAFVVGVGWPAAVAAQTLSGQARAAHITMAGARGVTTATLSDTGTLSGPGDAREASQGAGAVGTLLSGEALHATAIGWADQVASEASLANVALNVAGVNLGADFVMARALAASGTDRGSAIIDGLSINGVPIAVTGSSNQRIELPGALVVINEQRQSAQGIAVNAIHVVIDGVADILIASAGAAIQ